MKKTFKMLTTAILVITMIITTFTGCSNSARELYSAQNTDIRLCSIFFSLPDSNADTTIIENSEKAIMDAAGLSSENITLLEDTEEIKQLKKSMIDFFNSEFNVDITEKISPISTYLFTTNNNRLFGYHIPGDNRVFVNNYILENTPELFAFTWCHEVIHILGIDYDTNYYWGLYEAVTEAVNYMLFDWMGNSNLNTSAYEIAAMAGKQLIMANPELVSNSISYDSFLLEDNINSVLKDATYPMEKLPEDISIAYHLNCYLICLIECNELYLQVPEIFHFTIQDITTAYCRRFNPDKKLISQFQEYWLIKNFNELNLQKTDYGYTLVK